jgi:hypothetical protein
MDDNVRLRVCNHLAYRRRIANIANNGTGIA